MSTKASNKWHRPYIRSRMAPILLTLLWVGQAAATEVNGFPFDMDVTDIWVTNSQGAVIHGGEAGPANAPLAIHCAWRIQPTQFVQVNKPLSWNGNLIKVNGNTQKLFPLSIPADAYGHKSWSSGGIAGIGSTKHAINGKTALTGTVTATFKPQKAGNFTVSCELDTTNQTGGQEKNRSNNAKQATVTVSAPPLMIVQFKKKPALHGSNLRKLHCLTSLKATLTPALDGVAPNDIATQATAKSISLPLVGSKIFLKDSILCNYAIGTVISTYTLKCKAGKADPSPNTYWCLR